MARILGLCMLAVTLNLQSSFGLECYNCTDVSHVEQCHTIEQCQQGSNCRASFKSNKYSLGCAVEDLCSGTGSSGSLVGRSVTPSPVQDGCAKCCNSNNCNRQLCQVDDPSCQDSGTIDCALTASVINICADTDRAKNVCKRFCGLCYIVNGNWTHWSAWSPCSVSCSNGTVTRVRSCTDPPPANGGTNCTGDFTETRGCSLDICPDDRWTDWYSWGPCSRSCDGGIQTRYRTCANPPAAPAGGHTLAACPGEPMQVQQCAETACTDGHWSGWGAWSSCSTSCDPGIEKRSRSCTNPAPSILGKPCAGDNLDVRTCFIKSCPGQRLGFTVTNPSRTSPVVFTKKLTHNNIVNDFNTSTGFFIIRERGEYFFTLNMMFSRESTYNTPSLECSIDVEGGKVATSTTNPDTYDVYIRHEGTYAFSTSAYIHVGVGYRVYASCASGIHPSALHPDSSFAGFLIRAGQQIGFTVRHPAGLAPIKFTEKVSFNDVNEYDTSTGFFIIRTPGEYFFSLNLIFVKRRTYNTNSIRCMIEVEGGVVGATSTAPDSSDSHHEGTFALSTSAYIHVSFGYRVSTSCGLGAHPSSLHPDSTFTGFLIRAD